MKKLLPTALFAMLLVFGSCVSSLQLTHQTDPNTDFKQFKTYSLMPWNSEVSSTVSLTARRKLTASIKEEMDRRGFVFQEKGGELVVGVYVILEEMHEVRNAGFIDYNRGYNNTGMHYYGTTGFPTTGPNGMQSHDFLNGTIVLDIYDDAKKTQIYRSIGIDRLTKSREKTIKAIPKYVRFLYRDFPIKP